jgi:hypothetical protein
LETPSPSMGEGWGGGPAASPALRGEKGYFSGSNAVSRQRRTAIPVITAAAIR